MIGTTRVMTDASGSVVAGSQSAHTAFGEAISPNGNHRYGYAGAWGYQSLGPDADPVGYGAPSFLHVGHRYYDPSSGRFLQRDPIGINGGGNVYAYVGSTPTIGVDPTGLWWWEGAAAGAIGGGIAGARGGPYTFVACIVVGFVLGGMERGDLGHGYSRGGDTRGECMRGCHSQGR